MDRDEHSLRFEIERRIRDLREGIQALDRSACVDERMVHELLAVVEQIETDIGAAVDR